MNRLTYISLFSSAGVGCYGFKMEGFDCVATNELLPKRLDFQKCNNKCKYDSGYILCDNEESFMDVEANDYIGIKVKIEMEYFAS